MSDPLGLKDVPTPMPVRDKQIEPPAHVAALYKRITGPYADSTEMKVTLLAHLVFLTYQDLKDTCTP